MRETSTKVRGFALEIEGNGRQFSGAVFSPDEKYRYVLWREWSEEKRRLVVIGLNPSTADATKNDRTVTRCINFAKREDCGGLIMLNLFALRATDPKVMLSAADPIGTENDKYIAAHCFANHRIVLCAWGVHGGHRERDVRVAEGVLGNLSLWCLGTTKEGDPRHPLYIRADRELEPFSVFR
jgi:hypothetical protein